MFFSAASAATAGALLVLVAALVGIASHDAEASIIDAEKPCRSPGEQGRGHSRSTCTNATEQQRFLLGIGMQKAGTTSLMNILELIPELVKIKGHKETHFFDKLLQNNAAAAKAIVEDMSHLHQDDAALALDEYISVWGEVPLRNWVPMEITPTYTFTRHVPYVMMDVLKPLADKVRFVVLLRDPVDRAYSGYFQRPRDYVDVDADESDHPSFLELVQQEMGIIKRCYASGIFVSSQTCQHPSRQNEDLSRCIERLGVSKPWYEWHTKYIKGQSDDLATSQNGHPYWIYEGLLLRGMYLDQLRNFICAGWQPQQFLVITLTEMREDPAGLLARLSRHLNLTDSETGQPIDLVSNRVLDLLEQNGTPHRGSKVFNKQEPLDPQVREALADFFSAYNHGLLQYLRTEGDRDSGGGFHINEKYLDMEFR